MPYQDDFSPWGEIQDSEELYPGIYLVSTASHGGIMVNRDAAVLLSPAAQKCGFHETGCLCFEEDSDEHIVLRELLDSKLWKVPARIKDPAAFEAAIDRSIQKYHPEYWASRARRLNRADSQSKRDTRKKNTISR